MLSLLSTLEARVTRRRSDFGKVDISVGHVLSIIHGIDQAEHENHIHG